MGLLALVVVPVPPALFVERRAAPVLARVRRVILAVVAPERDEIAGVVIEAHLKESSGYSILDDAALDAVKTWRLKPLLRGSVPVLFRITNLGSDAH